MTRRPVAAIIALTLALAVAATSRAEESTSSGRPSASPRTPGRCSSASPTPPDDDHYAVSGFQGRFPLFAFDRTGKSDRFGGLGLEIGAYPIP